MTIAAALERRAFTSNSRAQLAAYSSWAPVVAYSGRLGSSKTRTVTEGPDYDCRMWPGNLVAVTRKKAVDLLSGTLDVFMTHVVPPHEHGYWRVSKEGGAAFLYPNGSVLRWFGVDNPGKALSAEYGSIYVDQAEELDELEYKSLEGRLRTPACFVGASQFTHRVREKRRFPC